VIGFPLPRNARMGSVGYIMSHAVTSPKPWQRQYLRDALLIKSVQPAHLQYLKHIHKPQRLCPEWLALLKQAELLSAGSLTGFLWGKD